MSQIRQVGWMIVAGVIAALLILLSTFSTDTSINSTLPGISIQTEVSKTPEAPIVLDPAALPNPDSIPTPVTLPSSTEAQRQAQAAAERRQAAQNQAESRQLELDLETYSRPSRARVAAQRAARQRAEALYRDALEALPVGEFFHTVPDEMKANVPMLIEAGIAQEVTQQLLEDLHVQGQAQIRPDVRYDPLGVEIKLDVDDTMFKTRGIAVGRKPIIAGSPEHWMWELTPLKRGKSAIIILAVVDLEIPGMEEPYTKSTVVFKEEREVQINLAHTSSQLFANNWKELSAIVFGSGSLAAAIKWMIEQREGKAVPAEELKPPAGFARFLPQKKSKD